MLEILFIFGVMGWLVGAAFEFVSSLAAFPTILTATVAVPLLAWADYLSVVQRLELAGLDQDRVPVPPERFYWTLHQRGLQRHLVGYGLVAVSTWAAAIAYPATITLDRSSAVGWIAGACAILSLARCAAQCVVYVRAAHWFNEMAPWAVGACRRAMYRLSQNPDFLDAVDTKRREEEKSVY